MKLLLLPFLALFVFTTVVAQPGALDSDFSADGKVLETFDSGSERGGAVIVQPDGMILVGGFAYLQGDYDFVIVRYNSAGSLDNTFGGGTGKVSCNFGALYDDYAIDMVLEANGNITLAGHTTSPSTGVYICLARFLPDGEVDMSFGTFGQVIVPTGSDYYVIEAMDVSSTGKYAVTGRETPSTFFVAQFNNDGTIDTGFDTDGIVTFDPVVGMNKGNDIKYQSDGKLVVTGYYSGNLAINVIVARYNTDGTLDNTFSLDGIVETDFLNNSADEGSALHLYDNGKILVAGVTGSDIALIRYNSDGTLDLTFNGSGKKSIDFGAAESATAITVQPDGKLLLAGTTDLGVNGSYMLVRTDSDGMVDNTFGTNGQVVTTFGSYDYAVLNSIALQPNLRIVVTGGAGDLADALDIATARYLSGLNLGVADFSANGIIPLIYPNPVKQIETLEYTLLQNEVISIELLNLNGSIVKTFVANAQRTTGAQRETLEFPADLAAGSYVIRLSSAAGQQSIRLVKN